MAEIGTDIHLAKKLLEAGEVVAIPTETVYGLAGNALNSHAVSKIFAVKNRPSFDPLIVHTHSLEAAQAWVKEIPQAAYALAEAFWPGSLTLLLPKNSLIPDLVTSGLPRVGIRIPNHPLTLELLKSVDFPLAAPSANPFGFVSPTRASHVADQLGEKIPYILDGGACTVGVESTIVGFEESGPVIYRMGGISKESIEAVIGRVQARTQSTSHPAAPGQLVSHYSPGKPLFLGDISSLLEQHGAEGSGILSFSSNYPSLPFVKVLSPSGDLEEAARGLFAALRWFANQPIDRVLAEEVPPMGIGRAINDRLRRAASLG
jgi:L-threonylcarbamoyladenylate synthase